MSYKYEGLREYVLTDLGQRQFLQMRDKVKRLLRESGAVRMQEVISGFCGDSWEILACFDRMVEIGELREVTSGAMITQLRVYVSG